MRMYYHSFDAAAGKFKIGMATSKDGFNWVKGGPVFEGGRPGDFDAAGAAACQVVRVCCGRTLTCSTDGYTACHWTCFADCIGVSSR